MSLLTRAALLALAKNTSDYKLVYKMLVKPETEGIQSKSKLKKQGNLISKIPYFFFKINGKGDLCLRATRLLTVPYISLRSSRCAAFLGLLPQKKISFHSPVSRLNSVHLNQDGHLLENVLDPDDLTEK